MIYASPSSPLSHIHPIKGIDAISPCTRLEMAQGGEPTLNPHLYDFLRIARKLTPTTQIQVTTNGLKLLSGEVTYKDLFAAGTHSVYVDMYGQKEKHMELARESGAEWYKYDKARKLGTVDHKMANAYYGDPDMRLIILQDSPEYRLRWRKEGRLSTFLNHIDWDAAIPYGLVPVRETYERKCTMPMRYTSLSYKGDYVFCCVDFCGETAGQMGNVSEGVGGFQKYWFGLQVQSIRRRLAIGDRASIPYCSRCNCAFSKCDWVRMWPEGSFDWWWDGEAWVKMPPLGGEEETEIFARGWQLAQQSEKSLPPIEYETELLDSSEKRIIKSTAAQVTQRQVTK